MKLKYFLFLLLPLFAEERPYYLTVCTMFKNEPAYPREWEDMREWITYNQMQGVDHFYIYPHNCTEDFLELFTPYVEDGVVTLIPFMDKPVTYVFDHLQVECFNHYLHNYGHLTEWCVIIDNDEFILPKTKETFRSYLQQFDNTDIHQVLMLWKCFGTSGWDSLPPGHLMTEHFTQCLNHDKHPFVCMIPQNITKGAFKPAYTHKTTVHHHTLTEGKTHSPTRDEIQVNHYVTKDLYHYTEIKVKRANTTGGNERDYKKPLKMYNEDTDTSIQYLVPQLKELMQSS